MCLSLAGSRDAELVSCALLQVGTMHATVRDAEPFEPGQSLWVAMAGAPRFSVTIIDPLQLSLGVDVILPIVRREYRLIGATDQRVFTPSAVGGTAHAGLTLTFP